MTGEMEAERNPCKYHEVLKPTTFGDWWDSGKREGIVKGYRFRNYVSERTTLLWGGEGGEVAFPGARVGPVPDGNEVGFGPANLG